jgi:hypothetical protein
MLATGTAAPRVLKGCAANPRRKLRIDRFWSWLRPGAWAVQAEFSQFTDELAKAMAPIIAAVDVATSESGT